MRDLIRRILREQTQPDVEVDIMNYKGDDKEINRLKALIYSGKILSEKEIEYAEIFFGKKIVKKNQIDVDDNEIENLLRNYSGNVKKINDFKNKVILNRELTPNQKSSAKDFFTKQRLSKTILSDLDASNPLGKNVKKKGIETFVDLIKSGKKYLFKPNQKSTIVVGVPGTNWVLRNIDDLTEFMKRLPKSSLDKQYELLGGEVVTLGTKISEILSILKDDPSAYPGFIEKNGEWSIMNKLDTNYTNWFRILSELDYEGKLQGRTSQEKVDWFFKQRPLNEILPQDKIKSLKEIEKTYSTKNEPVVIPTLSWADYYILKEYNVDFLKIKQRLIDSTLKGERNEQNIKGHLKLFSGGAIRENDILDFSSPGNRVDQVFGVDMMVHMYLPGNKEKYWVPLQAKSSKDAANGSNLLKYNIGGIAVFPTKNPEFVGGSSYGYLTVRDGTEKSFADLMEYNACRKREDIQSCSRYDK